jgi:uncharacterized Zn finger protein
MVFNKSWQNFSASKPLAVTGGIATSKARGAMADSWWSKRFVTVLDSYGLGGRMTRGRAYARKGQVVSLDIAAGVINAEVQGSRSRPYEVSICIVAPTATQWIKIEGAMQARLGFAARLLAGEVPADLEEVFASVGSQLFPTRWSDMKAACSCPDWGDPCKHQAAVLYVFADQLDRDPWQLIEWQGRSKDQILALFAGLASAADNHEDEIAAWWPLRPTGVVDSGGVLPVVPSAEPSTPPHAVLARLGQLDGTAYGLPIVDSLQVAYLPS